MTIRIHLIGEVSPKAEIGECTSIWHHAQIHEESRIAKNCIISKEVYIDAGVVVGDHVVIQNCVSVYLGITVDDGVFIGAHVVSPMTYNRAQLIRMDRSRLLMTGSSV